MFPFEQHDSVRTRLTHSLEVSSVARSLAKLAAAWLCDLKRMSCEQALAVETIAATCGLLHDMGIPPFGHFGEAAIQDWFKKRLAAQTANRGPFFEGFDSTNDQGHYLSQYANDFLKFEGNAQTIRLLSTLQLIAYEQQYVEFGLNLTCGTFSAACKYVAPADQTDSNKDDHARVKPGYFASENRVIAEVRQVTGTGDRRNPISLLVEACDDLVYCTGDLEDAVKKQIMSWEELKQELLEHSERDPVVEDVIVRPA